MRSPVRIRVSAPGNRFCDDIRRGDFSYAIRVCGFFLLSCPAGAIYDQHRVPVNLGAYSLTEPANFGGSQTFVFMQRMNEPECQLTIPANTQKSLHQAHGFPPCIRFCNSACQSLGFKLPPTRRGGRTARVFRSPTPHCSGSLTPLAIVLRFWQRSAVW